MAYQIFTGPRLESLVTEHQDQFRSGFFGPRPWIVVQSQSLAQWLKLFLARTLGGYATGELMFQDEALRRLIETATPEPERLLFLDDVKFELYRTLAAPQAAAEDEFAPLGLSTADPLRLFELADHIAGVFHNYAMNSTLWPAALGTGQLPSGSTADPRAFVWQSRLWRGLLGGERGTLAGLALEKWTQTPPAPSAPPPRLLLVGSAFLSRRAAAFLRSWAEAGLVDVVQLLLLPGPPPRLAEWPNRRPWSSWGAFGKAFLEPLPPAAGGPSPLPAGTSVLERLQGALYRGEPLPPLAPDESLEIVSAPHPLRELEVLRDRLLAALAADPTLEVHEIAVLAPDINVYAPFLDAAFASDDPGRHLRHHVIDLDLGRENAWFRALDALLSLISGTLDRPTLFTLIDTAAFREAWTVDAEERDLWLDYTEEVSAWREEPGDTGPQTWAAGADRLFEGWFRSSSSGEVPPLDTAPSAFRSLGRFEQLLEMLRAFGRDTRRARGFGDWIRLLDQAVAAFLAPGDGTGAVLSGRLRTLVRDAGSPAEPWPWAGFRAFVQDQIAHFPGRRGQLLTEGIHCSSLRPLRAIPFRFIAVLGLDEGRFPGHSPLPSFDLRRHEPGQEASSALALDRYCFWETLMAARSTLWLSYQGRSAVDGTERPPSSVLSDLLDFLEESGTAWPVTQATVKDFSVLAGGPPTGSPRTRRRAEAVASAVAVPRETEPAEVDWIEKFPEVRSSEVIQAFTAPARFHLKRVRQVSLRDEDRRGVDEEEPWSLSFLDREGWLQDQLRRHWLGQTGVWNVDAFLQRSTATGQARPGVFAERDRRELAERAQGIKAWADGLLREGWLPPAPRPAQRPRWAERPWAPEADDRLVRGSQVLLPKLLYTGRIPVRTKVEAAVRLLLDPAPGALLATLNPDNEAVTLVWGPDADRTRALAARAESYWMLAARRALPFYPDFLEALAERREAEPSEPWEGSVEEAWRKAWKAGEQGAVRSSSLLATDPYATLAFSDAPDWVRWGQELLPWWEDLWRPLLEAWV